MLLITLRYSKVGPEWLIIFGIVLFVYLIYESYFSTRAKIKDAIKTKKTSRIRDVKSGDVVRLVGKINATGRTLTAPLTGRECVYYHVQVEENFFRGHKNGWQTILDVKKRGDVILNDGTGYVLIRDRKAQTIIIPDSHCTSGIFDDALPEMEAFLNEHGQRSEGLLGLNKKMRYFEGVLEEGEQCVVVGKATWMKTGDIKLKLPVEKVLVIDSAPNVQSYISDDPDMISN